MPEATANKKQRVRKPVIRWKGLFEAAPMARRVAFWMLALAVAALSFSQFGFAGLGAFDDYSGYAVLMLLPVTLAALLLGTGRGTLIGLIAGAVMYLHASWMPLDYYELEFVSPFVCFVLLPLTAFVIGIVLSLAFRNERGWVRRTVYVLVGMFCASSLFTLAFSINGLVSALVYVVEAGLLDGAEANTLAVNQVMAMLSQMGDFGEQIWVDAFSMSAVSLLGAVAVKRFDAWNAKGDKPLHMVFNVWTGAAVTVAFMVTATFSFIGITLYELAVGDATADSEVEYLYDQYKHRGDDSFLDGYSVEKDALVLFFYTPLETGIPEVFMDNLPQEAHKETEPLLLADVLTAESYDTVLKNMHGGDIFRIVYDPAYVRLNASDWEDQDAELVSDAELRYAKVYTGPDGISVLFATPDSRSHAERSTMMMFITLSIIALLLVVFALSSHLLRRVVVSRIDDVNETLAEITEGDVSQRVGRQGTAEMSSLASGINSTVSSLERMIREAEKRMDAELATAKAIQENALPMDFPAFPGIDRFDIYASMKTAKEVGGDFYDFFTIGDDGDKVGFVMADVSGKGIPAALFMMTAKTQLRNYMEGGMAVNEAVGAANHQLCLGNEAGMFVTALACVIDYGTGMVEYVNAGHNPPLLCHNGAWEWKRDVSGMPLGLFDGMPYEKFSFSMEEGDTFYLYTDGVTEAMDADGTLFGEERLESVLERQPGANPRSLCVGVRRALTDFTKDAEQSDDITMLALKYGVPPEERAVMVLDADVSQLVHVNNYIHAELHRRRAPQSVYNPLDIAAEELFVNVCHYAYPDADEENPGEVRVEFEYSTNPPSLTVRLSDDGVAYNPLAKPDAVTPDDISEVPIGGLGILMAKKSVDSMEYERVGESNVLTFSKSW